MRITGPGVFGMPADPENSRNVVRRAVELGVNFIDTADQMKSGPLDPLLSSVFPLEQASAALKHLDQRRGLGRTLLQVGA